MSHNYGLIGEKLGHSISPMIHDEIFSYLSIIGNYNIYEIPKENLSNEFLKFKYSDISGLNVTIPYKVEVIKYLDSLDRKAEIIGSINTISFKEGRVVGYNTDFDGISFTFAKNHIKISKESSVVILGSGGASHAVLQYVTDNGVEDITFVVRDRIRASNSNNKLKKYKLLDYTELDLIEKKDVLINTTPCGMYPDVNSSPVPLKFLEGFSFVFDLIYNPYKTILLKYCDELNIKSSNGLYMLVGQAVAAEEIWNNIKLSLKDIDIIYEKVLKKGDFIAK
ncbi:shikimate dehydrogenase [Clostridium sp. 19966]|uniref:shikimate dehydrogenase n=1 Tax=Clostridium sp. 19966 TaxID=2768166 RepID=UPI0028DF951F|nr:shikimate dehydrogenase [Clostridium sp. 19966]MDT8716374.1 shikimate dehydrogenase [Clostridium sp. 19966]